MRSGQIEKIKKLEVVLGLKRPIVGTRFLFLEEEFAASNATPFDYKVPYCGLVGRAMQGQHLKATLQNFSCSGGPEMMGMRAPRNYEESGKQYESFRLYGDLAVAREAHHYLSRIDQRIYGIEVGPLADLTQANVVIMMLDSWQAMRVVQGYTFQFGPAQNIGTIGNQGMCADLTARPFMTNDINISLLCQGARLSTQAGDGEIGIGLPERKFWMTFDGVLETVNAATDDKRKRALGGRLADAGMELEMPLEFGQFYANYPPSYPLEKYEK